MGGGEGMSRRRERDDEAADGDESASDQHGAAGLLIKNDPGNDLRNQKEKHDIHANQPAEIPGWYVDRPTIAEQNYGSGEEEEDPRNCRRGAQTRADDRVATSLEERGQKQWQQGQAQICHFGPESECGLSAL